MVASDWTFQTRYIMCLQVNGRITVVGPGGEIVDTPRVVHVDFDVGEDLPVAIHVESQRMLTEHYTLVIGCNECYGMQSMSRNGDINTTRHVFEVHA